MSSDVPFLQKFFVRLTVLPLGLHGFEVTDALFSKLKGNFGFKLGLKPKLKPNALSLYIFMLIRF